MATYEYHCETCNRTFTVEERISEHGKSKPACPKCKGHKVKQLVSTFQTKTSRKS
jgi:putative FmdB family regulatory protein